METVVPLFSEYALPKFIVPTPRQIQEWLQQTHGSMTNDLRIARGLQSDPRRDHIKYTGPLTLAQQLYILDELLD